MTAQAAAVEALRQLGRAIPAWAEWLTSLESRFAAQHHGDYPAWEAALEALLAADRPTEALLQPFHPWRKGPWQFDDVTIDTEWRSDWKWARIQDHLDWADAQVLDIGSGNGYFGWQMLNAGARRVVGVDPTLLFCMQHLAAASLIEPAAENYVIPARFEELPDGKQFDLVLSMGVIYHRREPLDHVRALIEATRPGGEVLIESIVVEGESSLHPAGRYARMRNVHVVPSTPQLATWMQEAGLVDVRCIDQTPTTIEEQRSTPWMRFQSLEHALDPIDPSRTIEGHPAPVRAVVTGKKPLR